jgi:signal transduction histidine kinase
MNPGKTSPLAPKTASGLHVVAAPPPPRRSHVNVAARWRSVAALAVDLSASTTIKEVRGALRFHLWPHVDLSATWLFVEGIAGATALALGSPSETTVSSMELLPHVGELATRHPRTAIIPLPDAAAPGLDALVLLVGRGRVTALPLNDGRRTVGVLAFGHHAPLPAADLELLAAIGPLVGSALAAMLRTTRQAELQAAREHLAALQVHDLKNPLSIVQMVFDLLSYGKMGEVDQRDLIEDGRVASNRLLSMILDLLDISQAEDGGLVPRKVAICLATLATEVGRPAAQVAAARGIHLELPRDERLTLELDPKLIHRVCQNLLDNALRYAGQGGRVVMSVCVEGNNAVLRVGNTGPELNPALAGRLFDKYARGSEGDGNSNRGMGLYFCRMVVEAHGGRLSVGPEDDLGAVFRVELPMDVGHP